MPLAPKVIATSDVLSTESVAPLAWAAACGVTQKDGLRFASEMVRPHLPAVAIFLVVARSASAPLSTGTGFSIAGGVTSLTPGDGLGVCAEAAAVRRPATASAMACVRRICPSLELDNRHFAAAPVPASRRSRAPDSHPAAAGAGRLEQHGNAPVV